MTDPVPIRDGRSIIRTKLIQILRFRLELALFTFAILITRWNTLTQPLVERHDFRQTQTAFTTLTMANNAGGLFSSKLPIFGAPWELPFEFPLFQFFASIVYELFGTDIDFANRITSLVFFCLCLWPIYAIALRFFSRIGAAVSCAFFAFSPLAIQWSRASLIEYCVLFFGLVFVLYSLKYWEKPTILSFTLASIFGGIAGVVKVTTLLPMVVFLLFAILTKKEFLTQLRSSRVKVLGIFLCLLISLSLAQAWALFSDQIRYNNPATRWLTQSELENWTYGTLDQRKVISNWQVIYDRVDSLIVPNHFLVILLVLSVAFAKSRRIALSSIAPVLVTVSIFFNLYLVHDYYLIAISVFFAFVLGSVTDSLTDFLKTHRFRTVKISLAILMILGYSLHSSRGYWESAYVQYSRSESELALLSRPDQQAFVSWDGWNPLILYYANRKGMMLDYRSTTINYLRNLKDLEFYDFYAGNPDRPDVMQIRGLYSPVGRYTTRIDDEIKDFENYGIVFSRDLLVSTTRTTRTIPCDGATVLNLREFPIGTVLQTSPLGTAKEFSVSFNRQTVPIGSSIKILSVLPRENTGKLVCGGGGFVRFRW